MDKDQGKAEISNLLLQFTRQVAQKAGDPRAVTKKIQAWTGLQLILLRILCDLILEDPSPIPTGQEEVIVNQIVQNRIIQDWENNAAAEHLKEVQQQILDNERSTSLLKVYLKIIQKADIPINDSQDHQKLLEIGLVKEHQGRLKVANLVYATIFNLEWTSEKLPKIDQMLPPIPSTEGNRSADSTRFWSGLALLAVLIIAVVYPFLPKPAPPSPPTSSSSPTPSQDGLCTSDFSDQESQFNQLVTKKEQEIDKFPIECQSKLDKLSYQTGRKKASENDFNEGLRRLCQVSENSSDGFILARSQLNTWHDRKDKDGIYEYRGIITNYLKSLREEGRTCPAGKDISTE